MGKYGTNLEGFGAFEGGVNADKGAPLVSTSSDGATALLFGPAALREIQAGVANGDFAIPPDDATAPITDENPLPYWTLSNATSTVTIESSASAASANVLQFVQLSVGSNAILSRYVAIPSALDRSFSFFLEVYLNSYTAGTVTVRYAWAKSDFTATGTGGSTTALGFSAQSVSVGGVAPSDASYMYIAIESGIAAHAFSISEIRVNIGKQALYITDSDPTITPAKVTSTSGKVVVAPAVGLSLPTNLVSAYDRAGSADTTTIVTAGTYYALTNAEVSFAPQFEGQRWLLTFTGYASLNTTTIQYCFVRSNVVTTANVNVVDLGFSRADNFGTSGRGATVAFTKVYVATAADVTAGTRKYKLYGTVQTTNGLVLSLAYTQMTAYPIG